MPDLDDALANYREQLADLHFLSAQRDRAVIHATAIRLDLIEMLNVMISDQREAVQACRAQLSAMLAEGDH